MIQSKIASIFHHLMNQFISHILRPIFCNFIDKLEFTIILSWKPSAFFGYLSIFFQAYFESVIFYTDKEALR